MGDRPGGRRDAHDGPQTSGDSTAMTAANVTRTAVSPIHRAVVLIPPAPHAPPSEPADLWADARVGRKYDAAPHNWTPPSPLPVVQMACACGWRSPVLETPAGTRATQPTAPTPGRHAVVLAPAAFVTRGEQLWIAPAGDPGPLQSPEEIRGDGAPD